MSAPTTTYAVTHLAPAGDVLILASYPTWPEAVSAIERHARATTGISGPLSVIQVDHPKPGLRFAEVRRPGESRPVGRYRVAEVEVDANFDQFARPGSSDRR